MSLEYEKILYYVGFFLLNGSDIEIQTFAPLHIELLESFFIIIYKLSAIDQ